MVAYAFTVCNHIRTCSFEHATWSTWSGCPVSQSYSVRVSQPYCAEKLRWECAVHPNSIKKPNMNLHVHIKVDPWGRGFESRRCHDHTFVRQIAYNLQFLSAKKINERLGDKNPIAPAPIAPAALECTFVSPTHENSERPLAQYTSQPPSAGRDI